MAALLCHLVDHEYAIMWAVASSAVRNAIHGHSGYALLTLKVVAEYGNHDHALLCKCPLQNHCFLMPNEAGFGLLTLIVS